MYNWNKSYLYNRRAIVLVEGQCGWTVLLKQGVPQGRVLQTTLFTLYMNDIMPDLYADDLVLWCTEKYATTANYKMQIALDKVVTWAEQWCVIINREKQLELSSHSLPKSNLPD